MWKEFKEFAVKGNAIDLAVGVIIGAAFGKIVTSIVEDLLMPPLGRVLGNLNFADYYFPLSDKITPGMSLDAAKKAGFPVFAYGNFITVLINFLIVAFCIFLVVKAINKLKRPSPSAAPVAKDCPACAMSIPIKATRKLASRSEPDWHDCSIHPTITLDRPTRFGSAYKARSDPVHALSTRFLTPTAKTPAKSSNPIPAPAREILNATPRHRAKSPPDENAR